MEILVIGGPIIKLPLDYNLLNLSPDFFTQFYREKTSDLSLLESRIIFKNKLPENIEEDNEENQDQIEESFHNNLPNTKQKS